MTLPKKPLKEIKSPRGQILILFLLILVVGLAIVLSIASRTVTDIRTTTTSDESNRAYFAAEAGVEEALRQLGLGNSDPLDLDFSELNQSEAEVTIAAGAPATLFVYPEVIAKDDVAQLVLLNNWTAYDLSNTGWAGTLRIYWGPLLPADPTPPPAVEVAVIYATQVGANWFIQQGNISKVVFDPLGVGRPGPFNCAVTTEPAPLDFDGKNFNYRAEVDIDGASEGCTSLDNSDSDKPVLARIRLLYQSSPIAVEAVGPGDPDLPPQGDVIESSGNTLSGVTRKLEVTRLYPAVDALFDYVLFSGSGNALEK